MAIQRWEKIRVQDILEMTGISRSAFYAHFENKFDLLTAGIPVVSFAVVNPDDGSLDLLPTFEHVDEMSEILRPLLTQPVLHEVVAKMQRDLVAIWNEYLTDIGEDPDWVLAEFLAGAQIAVATKYLRDRKPEAPVEVARRFSALVNATVAHAAAP